MKKPVLNEKSVMIAPMIDKELRTSIRQQRDGGYRTVSFPALHDCLNASERSTQATPMDEKPFRLQRAT
ncbi:hypothetical protein [Novosphingobium sp. 11B]